MNDFFGLQANPNKDVRVASVFVLINLAWRTEQGAKQRVQMLHQLGCIDKLKALLGDSELEVRDRVRQAIDHFNMVLQE